MATPVYSAFAVVALESIWPSSDGDEVPINYLDLSYLDKRLNGQDFSQYTQNQLDISDQASSAEKDLYESSLKLKNSFDKIIIDDENKLYQFNVPSISRLDGEDPSEDPVPLFEFTANSISAENGREVFDNVNAALSRNQRVLDRVSSEEYFEERSAVFFIDEFPSSKERYLEILEDSIKRLTDFTETEDFKDVSEYIRIIEAANRSLLDESSYGTYPQGIGRPKFSKILTSEDAYKKRRGYFKIIPLNIVQASTSTGMGGQVGKSEFSVSFTLDDVLIIADTYTSQSVSSYLPTALPIDIRSISNEFPNNSIKNLIPPNASAFRVSGDDFTFNIEDLIETNDTATIWFYHDPKEFDFIVRESEEDVEEEVIDEVVPETETEKGFFVKKATYRTISELNETVLEVFIDHGVYVREDQLDLLDEVNEISAETVSYLINLRDTNDIANFDYIRFKSRTGVIYPPAFCTPERIERYRRYVDKATEENNFTIASSNLKKIINCEGTINTQEDRSLDEIIRTINFLTPNTEPENTNFPEEQLNVTNVIEENTSTNSENKIALNDFVLNKDFSVVVGNGSRKSQDDFKLLNDENQLRKNPPRTLVQSILLDSQILNPYTSPEVLSQENIEVNINNINSFDFLISSARNAGLDSFSIISNIGNKIDINDPVLNFSVSNISSLITQRTNEPSNTDNPILSSNVTRFFKNMYFPNLSNFEDIEPSRSNFNKVSVAMISSIKDVFNENQNTLISNEADKLAQIWKSEQRKIMGLNELSLNSIYGEIITEIFQTIIDYKFSLTRIAEDSLNFIKDQNQTKIINATSPSVSGYINRRSMLQTRSHGETPYLALKGHISSVKAKYGASQGSNLVTVSGSGYEKVLTENIAYYEDLFSPTGGPAYVNATESYPIYSQMLPPKAMLNFIETNAPRFILIGKPSSRVLDAKKMSLYFATVSKDLSTRDESEELEEGFVEEESQSVNILESYFKEDQVLVRGVAAIDINTSFPVLLGEQTNTTPEISQEEINDVSVRIFYPVNYLNTSRIKEMIRSLESAYEANIEEAVIKIPIEIATNQTIANNLSVFNGSQDINHLFVDETGRFRQRLAFEGLERTPQPEYTPTITDNEILASGASFSRDSSSLKTMVDIRANYQGTATGIVDARFAGRSLSDGNDYIPVLALSAISGEDNNTTLQIDQGQSDEGIFRNFYAAFSEPFFRYGMRFERINDIYTTSTRVAKRKSILYQGFYSKPLKTASISVKGNTSYRVGETVLVSLQKAKSRSREIIDVNKTLDWLNFIKDKSNEPDFSNLKEVYIGVDKRWLDYENYYLSSGSDYKENKFPWFSDFEEDPHGFVLDKFIETFTFIKSLVGRNNPLVYITPEYFPTTRWAFSYPGYTGKFGENVTNSDILRFYIYLYSSIVGTPTPVDISEELSKNPKLINAIRMQNFRSTSYHIDRVNHSYNHGESFVTNLTLNHGQDNLTLLDPLTMRPIGFMSIEKRMRIGYDDKVIDNNGAEVYENNLNKNTRDRTLWENYENERLSDLQVMYLEQFNQDTAFKNNSFLYTAQRYRNSSNFYYDLDLELS